MRHLIGKLTLVVTSLLLILVLLELGLKFFGGKLVDTTQMPIYWILADPENWQVDPDLIYVKSEVLNRLSSAEVAQSEFPLILIIGDSFMEGVPVAEDDGPSAQLALELARQNRNFEILNLGISGYGTDQELTMLQKALARGIRPEIVIWSFYVNDVFENGQQPTFTLDEAGNLQPISGKADMLFQRQKFFEKIPLPFEVKINSSLVKSLMYFFNLKINQQVESKYRLGAERDKWAIQKIKLEVDQVKRLADEYDFELVPVLIEPKVNYFSTMCRLSPTDENLAVEAIHDFLKSEPNYIRLNLNTLSLQERYQNIFLNSYLSGMSYFSDTARDSVTEGFNHFNEQGYKLFGHILAETIINL